MRFSQDFIERVRDANNLVDIIGQHTQLKPMSGGFMGRCPFPDHQEKTASFSVSESKQLYHCFGCQKKGNTFRFIQDFMGMGFPEAVEFLAHRANIALPEKPGDTTEQDRLNRRRKEIIQACGVAAEFFQEQFRKLPVDHPAKIYALQKRALGADILETFKIGYAPEAWDGLVQYLNARGISYSVAEEARLIKARKEGNGFFDVFRDRLMFPITNSLGEVVAFGGRVILQGEPKYLNSADTPAFTKGKILYGLSQTARFARSEDMIIVVEGYMDLVSLYQNGLRNVVATMGTAFTQDHGRLFTRITKNVAVLFDGDSAGQSAAERCLPLLLSQGLHPKGLILPDGQDPDDFVRAQGPDTLKSLLQDAQDLFSIVLGMWTAHWPQEGSQRTVEASEKIKICDQLKPVFSAIPDSRLADLYVGVAAKKLIVDEEWMRSSVGLPSRRMPIPITRKLAEPGKSSTAFVPKVKALEPSIKTTPEAVLPAKSQESEDSQTILLLGAPKAELVLMSLGLKNINYFNTIESSTAFKEVTSPGVRKVLEKAALTARQDPEKFDKLAGLLTSFVDRPDLLFAYQDWDLVEDPGIEKTMAESDTAREAETRMLQDCIKRIRDNSLKTLAEKLTEEVRKSPTPEMLEQLMNLQRERRALNTAKDL
jgi:DNA primase